MKPRKLPLATLSVLALTWPASSEILERVVVRVNADIVTQSEFMARQIAAAQAARVTPDRVETFLRENNARLLQEAIDELLIVQKAADLGIKLRAETLKDIIDGIKKENNIDSDAAFMEQLRHEGMSLDDLKRNIERSILARQVLSREIDTKISASEAEARVEYDTHKGDYTRPSTLQLQEILLKAEGNAAALEQARELVRRARAGEDFAALARAHSQAPSRSSGGDLGRLAQGELNPEIAKVALSLAKGEVCEPIPVAEGYKILRVAERSEGGVVAFDDVKADILKRLSETRRSAEYDKFVQALREKAIIEYKVREVPLQVELPGAATPRTAPGARPLVVPPPAEEEISATPQARPEHVTPTPARPTPSPTPTPPPAR